MCGGGGGGEAGETGVIKAVRLPPVLTRSAKDAFSLLTTARSRNYEVNAVISNTVLF